jgi:hypothetical protein
MNNFSTKYNYVGFLDLDDIAKHLFSNETIDKISKRISLILKEEYNLNYIITPKVIIGVLNQYFQNYVPYQNGDIYTKDTQTKLYINDLENLVEQSIYYIVSTISLESMQQYNNSKLNIWNSSRENYFSYIKVRERRPNNFSWIPAGQLGNNIPQMN